MKVTVVTPSYNQSVFIEDNLESVRAQKHPCVEHWVIDGGSDDGTVDTLEQFSRKTRSDEDYDLKWISEPDRGQSHAINKGFERAEGDIVGWLNSDDMYFDVETLRAVERAFRQSGEKVVYGDNVLVGPDNTLLRVDHKYDFSPERLLRSCYICQPALFFRRQVIENHRLDESLEYVMDYEFWLRLSTEYEFYHLDRILAADRNHPNRKMITNRQALIPERESVQKAHGQAFGQGYWLGRMADKAYSAWNRLRGVLTAEKTIRRTDLAFPLRVDTQRDVLKRQLFANNMELI
ncbi:glycosyltransferase family 2 protein [Salinibacter ruber]|uniref:glycosyltransferase family 2 protein n=1 Tax=Salinibacter ruber TaxID=146919 RepID=UPI002168282A|nr:glycosyltransferase family 2 protein [Salinibacter ruber]MCS4055901.1 glycosyltransferase involved in cell wall biosynthesis [Salinibacter ruber]